MPSDAEEALERAGYDPDKNCLTRRQAVVLALRQQGMKQREIAGILGTSRQNVTQVEASACQNIRRSHETLRVAEELLDDGVDEVLDA